MSAARLLRRFLGGGLALADEARQDDLNGDGREDHQPGQPCDTARAGGPVPERGG